MAGFTQKEIVALKEFRNRVSDALPDDFSKRDDYLIRWIRAREMDLDKAEDMLRKAMQYRKDNKIDDILKAGLDPELCEKFPYNLDGFDREGRPVLTMPFGSWDVRSFIEANGPDKFVLYLNQMLENVSAAIKRCTFTKEKEISLNENEDQPCVQFVIVSDMTGYSFRQLANMKAVQSILQMVSTYEAYYPETMGACIVINAPTVFSVLFGMMKPLMSGRTVEKIKIFSSNKDQWLPAVLEVVDPSEIREQFGGVK
ncbi:SEC14-like protein 4 [Orchesella cincta]|uniref:SEC14-like protein 4 n=1 Tax=Orchesella cincta TaxID=48709 RepID=A0A1D2NHV9_ORCCI|nr:SEC14-like protein 4 [Orchesella cincta]